MIKYHSMDINFYIFLHLLERPALPGDACIVTVAGLTATGAEAAPTARATKAATAAHGIF
jgi:hypothetical protein